VPEEQLDRIATECRTTHGARGADLNAAKIAAVVGKIVSRGDIGQGEKLPTVRSLAKTLHVSTSTVSDAWKILQAHAVISTDRRRGTIVRSSRGHVDGRYWHVPVPPGTLDLDLSTGTPDAALLPPLGPALTKMQVDLPMTSYLDAPVVPELAELLRERWPFSPEALTIVDGAQDALDRVVHTVVHLGDAVVVEEPTFPPIIDLLEVAGANIIGIELDEEGLPLDELEQALVHDDPVAIFLQPRSHNPTSVTMTRRRAEGIAELVRGRELVVVEDDHSGEISGAELASIGHFVPNQTVHIHSVSKTHGPDLRLAAIGGAESVLSPLIRRRHLGPSWTSRLLQYLLLSLLTDPAANAMVADAADIYRMRRQALAGALEHEGLHANAGTGINLWIPVPNEQDTMVSLAAHGIGVAPGRPFMVTPPLQDHIRVTAALVDSGYEALAANIAAAAGGRSLSGEVGFD
jgi:DNA-binding transcriptional MocR family regulator